MGTNLRPSELGDRPYVMTAIRTLVDPNDPKDLDEVHKLQDAIKVEQKAAGKLELPNWDQASLKEIRDALLVLAKHTESFSHAFGSKGQVDPIKHLIGTAAGSVTGVYLGDDPTRPSTQRAGFRQLVRVGNLVGELSWCDLDASTRTPAARPRLSLRGAGRPRTEPGLLALHTGGDHAQA
jgi:hypothetical protein